MRKRLIVVWLAIASPLLAVPGFYEPWGKDTCLTRPPQAQEVEVKNFGTRLADLIIRFHQKVISPVDGPRSHFRPSSSQYMSQAMHRYGFFRGFVMGCDRLLRENDEEWVYRKVEYDGRLLKYDPAALNKYTAPE